MSIKIFLRPRFAALAVGVLLTGVFVSGCQTKATTTTATTTASSTAPDGKDGSRTIHHPPGGQSN